ncbi:alpha/beta fold hydrolase [Rhodococcus rhodnii]|uniref:Esterase n=2 Tax=Rhodococcus rhodnii TaxID=38312 RepID=R7WQG6_9NOCA|nr:alpha/beta fold hydrolase [Rhodococcus rhodnii]EOM77566.1 esterase [Rhodococcus rhodnii LMG 5362]TXG89216.1 alpha/beta fold hydrolase [Rhodococcus rhodnii]
MTEAPAVVLVHGAWAGPWVWDTITGPLADAGLRPIPVTLPGVGSDLPEDDVTLDDVVEAVLDRIADVDGPLVIVGHSGGGVVATDVAERIAERVVGVAYVAGMMLPPGWSYGTLCEDVGLAPPVGISAFLEPAAGGRATVVPPEAGASVFFHDAPPADAVAAARRLVPQLESARLVAPTWTPDRFGSLPRLYVEATRDRSLPVATQRRMRELVPGAEVCSLDCDHAPQLSAPGELAAALSRFVHSLVPAYSSEIRPVH